MIYFLIGDDHQAIRAQIQKLRAQLDPSTAQYCYFSYTLTDEKGESQPTDSNTATVTLTRTALSKLQDAIADAFALPFFGTAKLVIIEVPDLKGWGDAHLELLQGLEQLPESTTLVFVTDAVDQRLKPYKALAKVATVRQFPKPSPWKKGDIAQRIGILARGMGVRLDQECLNYLAHAVGNDSDRAEQELLKLKLAANAVEHDLSLEQVKLMVPNIAATSLDLAAAMRLGQRAKVMALVKLLLGINQPMPVITATLITQFRLWMWVKGASRMQSAQKIAEVCELSNPKRLYYLKPEVAHLSIKSLAQAFLMLVELDYAIKSGAVNDAVLLSRLLSVTALFATD